MASDAKLSSVNNVNDDSSTTQSLLVSVKPVKKQTKTNGRKDLGALLNALAEKAANSYVSSSSTSNSHELSSTTINKSRTEKVTNNKCRKSSQQKSFVDATPSYRATTSRAGNISELW